MALMLLLALAGCGVSPEAAAATAVPPTPTAAPTPTPTLAQVADTLKAQLVADKVLVQRVEADAGALPTLTIAYEIDASATTAADIGAALERSVYTISKRVAQQAETGATIDRLVLILMLGDTQLASTRISVRDALAWSKGTLTDQQYQARWSQTLNPQ